MRRRPASPSIRRTAGMHGFDPHKMPEMKASFFAAGPDIRSWPHGAPFENVNLYPWLAHMLGLNAAEDRWKPERAGRNVARWRRRARRTRESKGSNERGAGN